MRQLLHVLAVQWLSLLLGTTPTSPQSRAAARHLVLEFPDVGSPATYRVEAKLGGVLHRQWTWYPASISLCHENSRCQALLPMPDVRCALFRIVDLSDDGAPFRIVTPRLRPADGLLFPFDSALIEFGTNDDLDDLPRFESYRDMVAGVHYVPGDVIVGFTEDTEEEAAVALFQGAGVPFDSSFPHMFAVQCRVISGTPGQYIEALEESDIVLWADKISSGLIVQFNVRATVEAARELLSSFGGLAPEWGNIIRAPKWGVIKVDPGKELAWIVALESLPCVRYAELNGIGHNCSLQ